MTHDPERLGSEILQCLRQDKKHLGLLLGAGCPSSMKDGAGEPLIPDIAGLTKVVGARVCTGSCALAWEETSRQLTEDGNSLPNIEEVLTRVRGLRNYDESPSSTDLWALTNHSLIRMLLSLINFRPAGLGYGRYTVQSIGEAESSMKNSECGGQILRRVGTS